MIVTVFAYHTASLILRMYVTERPPVTNLYSSAVFIGWGAVLLGIILEGVYKIGVGNIMASIAGFGSLQIAYLLTRQGDTIESLEAVLDTQFWLTTHVVCVTLGYATTFAAGLLGLIYLVLGIATKSLKPTTGKLLSRMIYGTLCFALFFSFVGTVLGGLWADDSWGRFWGWDPKENGALIIVLWNALVLHARWDGMIKDRGLAVLAVAGNITTSWSWFGVNQLGVGLHSYGFSPELLSLLFWFVVGSATIVAVGLIPRRLWLSRDGVAT
jgi:ABC-type transport system involved in cytochrome c biogenesis permease subunit